MLRVVNGIKIWDFCIMSWVICFLEFCGKIIDNYFFLFLGGFFVNVLLFLINRLIYREDSYFLLVIYNFLF